MKALLITLLISFFVCTNALAQASMNGNLRGSLYLYPNSTVIPANLKRGSYITPHFLGDSVTHKFNTFERNYVYYRPGTGAYAVEEQIVIKPSIYKAIKAIVKVYERNALSESTPPSKAAEAITEVLDIGIKLINYDTKVVEKKLKKLKSTDDKEEYLKSLAFAPLSR